MQTSSIIRFSGLAHTRADVHILRHSQIITSLQSNKYALLTNINHTCANMRIKILSHKHKCALRPDLHVKVLSHAYAHTRTQLFNSK